MVDGDFHTRISTQGLIDRNWDLSTRDLHPAFGQERLLTDSRRMAPRKCGKDAVLARVGSITPCVVCHVVDPGYVWMRPATKLDGLDC